MYTAGGGALGIVCILRGVGHSALCVYCRGWGTHWQCVNTAGGGALGGSVCILQGVGHSVAVCVYCRGWGTRWQCVYTPGGGALSGSVCILPGVGHSMAVVCMHSHEKPLVRQPGMGNLSVAVWESLPLAPIHTCSQGLIKPHCIMQCVTVLQSEQCACNCTYVRTRILNIYALFPPPPPHTHTDVAFFRHSLVRYRRQHNQALACPKLKDVGMILVDTNDLREDLLPNPMRCLKVRLSTVLMSVAAYVHMYVRTHSGTHVHTYIHTVVRTYVHTHSGTYVHTHSGTYMHTYIHTYAPALLPHQPVPCRYIRMYVHPMLYVCTLYCMYITIYVHTYIGMYIQNYTYLVRTLDLLMLS